MSVIRGSFRALAIPLLLALTMEVWFRVFVRISDIIAPPTAILSAGVRSFMNGDLLFATGQTFLAAGAGLIVGGGAGALSGLVLGLSPSSAKVASTTIELLRPIPVIAIIPLAMLAYGFGYQMEVSIVALATFWPSLILSQKSVAQINRGLFEVGRVLALGPVEKFIKIILPAALPRLFLALRVSVGIAIIVAVTVEIAANPQGIGYFMMTAQQSLQPDLMLWGLVWIGIMGWGLNVLLVRSEKRLFGRSLGHQARPAR